MNRGTFAILYMLISSIINIIYTLVVCAIVVVGSLYAMKFLFHPDPKYFGTAVTVFFVIGLLISFITYSKISMKVVKKYKFDERFGRSAPKNNNTAKAEPKKTVLPNSVKEVEEEEKWRS